MSVRRSTTQTNRLVMSKSSDAAMWGIHAGKCGAADALFLERNCIAIGWGRMGDLSTLHPTREAFKARLTEKFPGKTGNVIPNNAGQLFRFVHEMKQGD